MSADQVVVTQVVLIPTERTNPDPVTKTPGGAGAATHDANPVNSTAIDAGANLDVWTAEAGRTVQETLLIWSKRASWDLDIEKGVGAIKGPTGDVTWRGDLSYAVRMLFQMLPDDTPVTLSIYAEDKAIALKKVASQRRQSTFSVASSDYVAPATWSHTANESLRTVLARWTDEASWSLIWEADAQDVELTSDANYRGVFSDAAQSIAKTVNAGGITKLTPDLTSKSIRVSLIKGGPKRTDLSDAPRSGNARKEVAKNEM